MVTCVDKAIESLKEDPEEEACRTLLQRRVADAAREREVLHESTLPESGFLCSNSRR